MLQEEDSIERQKSVKHHWFIPGRNKSKPENLPQPLPGLFSYLHLAFKQKLCTPQEYFWYQISDSGMKRSIQKLFLSAYLNSSKLSRHYLSISFLLYGFQVAYTGCITREKIQFWEDCAGF